MARLGVDVGGTNTDLILEATADDPVGVGIFQHKVPSTKNDQSEGVVRGITELCEKADGILPYFDASNSNCYNGQRPAGTRFSRQTPKHLHSRRVGS